MKFLKVTAALLAVSIITAFFARFPFKKEENNKLPPPNSTQASVTDLSDFAENAAILSHTSLSISAKSAILCTSDGLVIYEKNADIPLPMASITKLMTAVVALENISDIKEAVIVSDKAIGVEGSSVYLKNGEKVDHEMLLYSAMLESANDATLALAIAVAGSEEKFVSMMNEKASELGMEATVFKNPHGLSDDGHYTTSRDYAKLMAYALQNEKLCEIISTKKKIILSDDGTLSRVLTNHNRLLNTYKGMVGGKTGFTKVSGRTLVTAAERNGTRLICVTINAPDDWNDHTTLFDTGFNTVKTLRFTSDDYPVTVDVAGGMTEKANCSFKEFSVTLPMDAETDIKVIIPHMIFAPMEKGSEIGRVVCSSGGKVVKETAMYLTDEVLPYSAEKENIGFFDKIKELFER